MNEGDFGGTNVPPGLSNVIALATGSGHQCVVLKADGTVATWGWSYGDVPDGLSNVVAVAAGNHPSLALKSDGTVVGWPSDTQVPAGLSNIVAVAGEGFHSGFGGDVVKIPI